MSDDTEDTRELSLKEKLAKEITKTDFAPLKEHCERGALFQVGKDEDILEAALAMAEDNVAKIRSLLATGDLQKVEGELAEQYGGEDAEIVQFDFLIIQPYVLIKPISEEEE